jgi:DNA-binding phage protein
MNEKLAKLMEKKRIGDTTLAKMAGVSRQTIYRMRMGIGKSNYDSVERVAKALNKRMEDII